jgi:hypothetical protein
MELVEVDVEVDRTSEALDECDYSALGFGDLEACLFVMWLEMVLVTMCSTSLMILGLTAMSKRMGTGKLTTHCLSGLAGSTSSTRWAVLSDMRHPPQLEQKPRRLQLNAMRVSLLHDWH